jgi:hypothetical protein
VEGSCEQSNKPSGSGKFLSSCAVDGFSRRTQLNEVSSVSFSL